MRRCNIVKVLIPFIILMITMSSFLGCSKKISEAEVSYAGPMLENVLTGMKEKDYDKFSKDFSSKMKEALPKDKFSAVTDPIDSKIGDYKEKSFSGATTTKKDNSVYTVVVYKAKYSKETSDVLITISFSDNNGNKKIEGFVLNSPNLRK